MLDTFPGRGRGSLECIILLPLLCCGFGALSCVEYVGSTTYVLCCFPPTCCHVDLWLQLCRHMGMDLVVVMRTHWVLSMAVLWEFLGCLPLPGEYGHLRWGMRLLLCSGSIYRPRTLIALRLRAQQELDDSFHDETGSELPVSRTPDSSIVWSLDSWIGSEDWGSRPSS